MATTPAPITALPTPPSRSDPSTFSARGDAFLGAFPTLQTEINALSSVNYSNTVLTETKATEAVTSAYNALVSEMNAASVAGAPMWVSGTTYALGAAVWSPLDRLVYRRTIAGSGTTDPSLDLINWAPIGAIPIPPAPAGSNIFLATNFGGF